MSITRARELFSARQHAAAELRRIDSEAGDAEFTAEQRAAYDRANADYDRLGREIESVLADAERSAADADLERRIAAATSAPSAPQGNDVTEQVRSFLRGERRSLDVTPGRVLRMSEFRDLTKGSATAGGNTVPTSFYDQLIAHLIEVSGVMMAGPTVLNTASGENLEVPVTTAHSSAALTSEATGITESDPAFAKRTLGAYKYATLIQISRELIEDTGVDLLGYLSMQAGRACGNAFGAHLATGTGSSQPAGIATGASTGVTGATSVSGAFTADNLIDLHFSVIAPYRNSPSCAWLMRDATLGAVRKLKTTDNQYIWQPGMTVGAPDTLLSKPVYTDPNIAAVATSAKSVLFGDMSAYFVRLAGGVRFERSDEYAFNADLVTFRCVVRGDGILADQTGAVKAFVGGAS